MVPLKEKVYSTHMESCMARIKSNTEGKLRMFRTFKQDYCMEGYLLLLPNLNHMSTIARFRMSSHTLAIETGRHAKPKIAKEERKCRDCNLDDVEDEKHFLLKCPVYNEERLSLFYSVVLKVGYHTESRCQYQPASFSSAFILSGTACLVGVGVGVPSSDLGHVMKEVTTSPHPLLLLLYHFTPLQGVLTPFPNYFM